MGLSAAVGDARHRLRRRAVAGADSTHLRLAHDLQPQPRQVPHHHLLRLPGRWLHHGGGRPDLRFHAGAEQRHGVRFGADHRHAGVLRPGRFRLRALPRERARRDAEGVHRDRRAADRLRLVARPHPRPDRHLALSAAPHSLLRLDLAAGLSDGLPDADGNDLAGATRQGPHVPVGVGHQRLLLRHRSRCRSDHRDLVRSQCRADDRRRRLPGGNPGVLCGAVAAAASPGASRGPGASVMTMSWIIRGNATCVTLLASTLLQGPAMSAPAPKRELAPLRAAKTALVPFDASPFPYRGEVPEKGKQFLDVTEGERLGHYSVRAATTYWEDQTYSDRRVLLHIPKGFDPRPPAPVTVV